MLCLHGRCLNLSSTRMTNSSICPLFDNESKGVSVTPFIPYTPECQLIVIQGSETPPKTCSHYSWPVAPQHLVFCSEREVQNLDSADLMTSTSLDLLMTLFSFEFFITASPEKSSLVVRADISKKKN